MYLATSVDAKQTTGTALIELVGEAFRRERNTMAAIVHALYIIGQLFAIMGVVLVVPLLVCDCCRYCWKRRCARRERCKSDLNP